MTSKSFTQRDSYISSLKLELQSCEHVLEVLLKHNPIRNNMTQDLLDEVESIEKYRDDLLSKILEEELLIGDIYESN